MHGSQNKGDCTKTLQDGTYCRYEVPSYVSEIPNNNAPFVTFDVSLSVSDYIHGYACKF